MSRETFFFLPEDAPSTFSHDENLENLPLPKLEDTLERYYRNLLPFGNEVELENSRKIIEEFKNGIGKKLQKMLEEKASKERNWVEKFWEDYAYHELRFPLSPFCIMAQPLIVASVGLEESRTNRLKALATTGYHSGKFWQLIYTERLRPPTNPDGSVTFSSDLFKRLFNTCRIPGEAKDVIQSYFKTKSEGGDCPKTILIIGKGRVFYFDFMIDDKVLSPQEFLYTFSIIRDKIENEEIESGIPVLTCDERTSWAKNRKYLIELSKNNAELLNIIESAAMTLCLDDNEPIDYSETSIYTLSGDYSSRWLDKSSAMVSFKNGKFGCIGEHSAYDGTVSIAFSTFILLSLMEEPEPDWSVEPKIKIIPKEIKFQIDDHLRNEIVRVEKFLVGMSRAVTAKCTQFDDYGKAFMKEQKIHPDCYVQTALQLAYYNLHGKLAPTYETATMRVYYHGRTETVRSCTIEVKEWIDKMHDENASTSEKAKYFKEAANSQYFLMNEARKGRGFDRHLFALWCIAHENNIPIPALYNDQLYTRSGGGGNFVLSTSTLGYTINVGFVAAMVLDGYGIFYSMLDDCVWIITTAYRDSEVTSNCKFYASFVSAMKEIKDILENSTSNSKL
ncbi:hypothetical protein PVAND_004245 [Polypedilum vanderplanki]|uniref:Choline/carnitine acyltransferase domain-containing protein n=1 Tax=Polypedilum vanderplanki TaxID=319348 RepID=A0A9J6BWE5_POLVA|nr:hypothetical protein PVAND_004245 [Polypedilum vanderplanki]